MQFLGVIKCLNNPYCAKCRIANTKKPHRAIFRVSELFGILRSGTSRTSPYAISSKDSTCPTWACASDLSTTLHISCVPLTDALGLETSQGKNPFRPTNSTYEIIS